MEQVSRWRDEAIHCEFLWALGQAPPLPMHHHPTLQIGLVRRGVLDICAAGGFEGSVSAPCLVIVPPRVPHSVAGRPGCEVEYAQVELDEAHHPLIDWLQLERKVVVAITDTATHCAFLELLHASNDERPAAVRKTLLEALAKAILAAHLEELGEPSQDPIVERILSRLERVTDRALPLSELVEQEGVPRSTLLRRFQRRLGSSPHDYHVSVRRNAAFKLIEQGRSVADASLEAGFHDQSHFTRHARIILAMAPGSWRRRRRLKY